MNQNEAASYAQVRDQRKNGQKAKIIGTWHMKAQQDNFTLITNLYIKF